MAFALLLEVNIYLHLKNIQVCYNIVLYILNLTNWPCKELKVLFIALGMKKYGKSHKRNTSCGVVPAALKGCHNITTLMMKRSLSLYHLESSGLGKRGGAVFLPKVSMYMKDPSCPRLYW